MDKLAIVLRAIYDQKKIANPLEKAKIEVLIVIIYIL
ncbi:hypothetical protein FHR85_001116 [Alkalibacillus almallahensis]|nr:hypothetical protein [Alkalibacillus almallahensis]